MNKQLLKFLVVGLCFSCVGSRMEAVDNSKPEDKKVEETKKIETPKVEVETKKVETKVEEPKKEEPSKPEENKAPCRICTFLSDYKWYITGLTVVGLAAAVTAYVMLNQNDENTDEKEAV